MTYSRLSGLPSRRGQ